jgi:glutamine cyclotransferase
MPPADEKKILLLYDWERDMPVHCQRCDGNRYIGAILYANLEAKREIDKLRAELEKAHKFIDALSEIVSAVSAENRERILNGIREMAGGRECAKTTR